MPTGASERNDVRYDIRGVRYGVWTDTRRVRQRSALCWNRQRRRDSFVRQDKCQLSHSLKCAPRIGITTAMAEPDSSAPTSRFLTSPNDGSARPECGPLQYLKLSRKEGSVSPRSWNRAEGARAVCRISFTIVPVTNSRLVDVD